MADAGVQRPRRSSGILQRHDLSGSAARFWQSSYAPDYVGITLLVTAYILIQAFMTPFHRMFALDDLAIQYPHADIERVPPGMLLVYGGVVPSVAIALWAFAVKPGGHKVHVTYLGLITSIFVTTFLTDVVKNAVGRPRPDLIARCKPRDGTDPHILVTIAVCTETKHHLLHDGWRSFPSGHSSFAFSGLGFLALLIAGQLALLHPHASLANVLLGVAPILGAAMIAISRTEDYRHDVFDVCAGSALGLLVAWFTYRRYYPALRSRRCDEPFASRADYVTGMKKDSDEETRIGLSEESDEDAEGDSLNGRR